MVVIKLGNNWWEERKHFVTNDKPSRYNEFIACQEQHFKELQEQQEKHLLSYSEVMLKLRNKDKELQDYKAKVNTIFEKKCYCNVIKEFDHKDGKCFLCLVKEELNSQSLRKVCSKCGCFMWGEKEDKCW